MFPVVQNQLWLRNLHKLFDSSSSRKIINFDTFDEFSDTGFEMNYLRCQQFVEEVATRRSMDDASKAPGG